MFTAALFTVAKAWEPPTCPLMNGWIKTWYVYTMEHSSPTKKKEIRPSAATWMDLEIVIPSAVSQAEKEKYHMTSLICGIQEETTELTKQRLTDLENELRVAGGGRHC